MTMFQVVSECVHVTVDSPLGRVLNLLYKGALVPADAPEVGRLLDLGYIARVGGDETGGVNAAGVPAGALEVQVPVGVTSTPVEVTPEQQQAAEQAKADAEVQERRAAAKAKLPADGALPDGRAAQAVWVEWLVAAGSRYEDVAGVDKAELVELARQRQQ